MKAYKIFRWFLRASALTTVMFVQEKRTYQDQRYQDEMDAETIYNTLENEIVPLYFKRENDIPTGWVAAMKKCLAEISPRFTMKRMMDDYFNQYYNKLIKRTNWMRANRYKKAFEQPDYIGVCTQLSVFGQIRHEPHGGGGTLRFDWLVVGHQIRF